MVFAVLFTITLKCEADEKVFLTAFKDLTTYVSASEPATLTYELHHELQDGKPVPFSYAVVERYHAKADAEEDHLISEPFKKFFAIIDGLDASAKCLKTFDDTEASARLAALPAAVTPPPNANPLRQRGILVFGGARHGKRPEYAAAAAELGAHIASKTKQSMVYGGGTVGLMGEAANAVKANGGRVIAIIPKPLCPREASGEMIGDMVYYAANMAERKSMMFAYADTIIAMPGGVGTYDELLEALTLFQLNAHRPKIGLLNVAGFFDAFITFLQHLVEEGFLDKETPRCFVMKPTVEELMTALDAFVPPPSAAANLVWNVRP